MKKWEQAELRELGLDSTKENYPEYGTDFATSVLDDEASEWRCKPGKPGKPGRPGNGQPSVS